MAGMTLQDWIDAYIPKGKVEDNMMKIVVTQTDTFGGEANYSWANRHEFAIHREASQRIHSFPPVLLHSPRYGNLV